MKRFVLDTTYLLPVIGISVKKISGQDVARFRSNVSFETAICDITIFELSAKGAKYVAKGKLEGRGVSTGIDAIIKDDSLMKLQSYDDRNLATAFKLRETLNDFIDCLILSTAVNQADVLLTEDGFIHNLKRNETFKELIRPINPKFQIQRLSEN
ncbi:MAG: PIN domain-containing protein [archaeon]|nr:PIN domain-containing protein [archaeon]